MFGAIGTKPYRTLEFFNAASIEQGVLLKLAENITFHSLAVVSHGVCS